MKKFLNALNAALCLLLATAISCSLLSCSLLISAENLSQGYSRKATEKGEISKEFTASMANFSIELFKGISHGTQEKNLISPLSAVLCLAMLANGAEGETKVQLEQVFGMDIQKLNESLYAYTQSLNSSKECRFNLADSVWFRDDKHVLHVREEFLQTNADWYDAQIYKAPFDNSTLRDINNWCKKYTDGMIDSIIHEIPGDTVMYLINALAFDAEWAEKYSKNDIKNGVFHNRDTTETSVKYLNSTESIYLSGEGVVGFAKNYAGNRYSFVGLLPDAETDIYAYISSLSGEKWLSLWNERKENVHLQVKIPELSYDTHMNLNQTLKNMGLTDMFDSDRADFSGLGHSERGNLYCSLVEQKTFLEVSAAGTKAAALTWAEVKCESAPFPVETEQIFLDRPFIYAIVDNHTGLPVFLGAVAGL